MSKADQSETIALLQAQVAELMKRLDQKPQTPMAIIESQLNRSGEAKLQRRDEFKPRRRIVVAEVEIAGSVVFGQLASVITEPGTYRLPVYEDEVEDLIKSMEFSARGFGMERKKFDALCEELEATLESQKDDLRRDVIDHIFKTDVDYGSLTTAERLRVDDYVKSRIDGLRAPTWDDLCGARPKVLSSGKESPARNPQWRYRGVVRRLEVLPDASLDELTRGVYCGAQSFVDAFTQAVGQ